MSKEQPRVLFYFLHLLGVGHVFRAQRLIAQFRKQGILVDVIYGGMPVPNIKFDAESICFLPPVQTADNTYASNLDGAGALLSEAYLSDRQDKLLEIFRTLDPDLILIEAYPFGRRVVRKELKKLLKAAKSRTRAPLIASSVRDILQENRKQGRAEETRDLVRDFFDVVYVHSDPNIIKLDATYPLAHEIIDKIQYTGFVVPDQKSLEPEFQSDIIVSAGGGAFGDQLMDTAMQLAETDPFPNMKWCLATGPNLTTEQFETLKRQSPAHVKVVQRVPHLAGHLQSAKLSISQCGYNTAMDVLSVHQSSDVRAVFVPYDTEGQTVQARRAALLDKAGYAINLPQSQLNPESLLAAMKQALILPKVESQVNFSGAEHTAKLIKSFIKTQSTAP